MGAKKKFGLLTFVTVACALNACSPTATNSRTATGKKDPVNCEVPATASEETTPKIQLQSLQTCNDPKQISCDHKIYSPELKDGSETLERCATSAALGKVCFSIQSWNYNTAALKKSEAPQHFEPGGSLNFEEYSCYLKSANKIQGRGVSLSEALVSVLSACQAALAKGVDREK